MHVIIILYLLNSNPVSMQEKKLFVLLKHCRLKALKSSGRPKLRLFMCSAVWLTSSQYYILFLHKEVANDAASCNKYLQYFWLPRTASRGTLLVSSSTRASHFPSVWLPDKKYTQEFAVNHKGKWNFLKDIVTLTSLYVTLTQAVVYIVK